ncbi:MAG: aminoacyl-tRNA hydrolase [Hyphomicrobiales bacterium]|nr:aminoacyl-tRNA hydrolase [Hyphomicrobiales bacterium]PCH50716.1 MAG: aminoacyl-tRNA hydrolase [Hyphomicrobiales bacterium]
MADPQLTIPESELSESFIRSAGPGGQNVNKVSTAVQLRFDVANSPSLTNYVKARLMKLASHLMTHSGELILEASKFRQQGMNREDARKRLAKLIAEASKPPPPRRRKTKPTRGSVERRLKKKSGRSKVKKMRGRVQDE